MCYDKNNKCYYSLSWTNSGFGMIDTISIDEITTNGIISIWSHTYLTTDYVL